MYRLADQASASFKTDDHNFVIEIQNNRIKVAKNVLEFNFNNKRVNFLSKTEDIPQGKKGICYWMCKRTCQQII
jgi:hypothetical protein